MVSPRGTTQALNAFFTQMDNNVEPTIPPPFVPYWVAALVERGYLKEIYIAELDRIVYVPLVTFSYKVVDTRGVKPVIISVEWIKGDIVAKERVAFLTGNPNATPPKKP